MAGKAEIIVGVVNDGVTVGSGATAVADQFLVNGTGMVLVSQTAQTGAVIASVTSVTKLAGPYVPIVSMPANIVAGTITFLKIGVDVRDGNGINKGDALNLVGDVAGVLGTMAILVASPSLIIASMSVSILVGGYSIYKSQALENIVTNAANFFNGSAADNYLDYVCAPDMKIVHKETLRVAYGNQMLSCNWFSATGEFLPSAIAVFNENIGGGGSYAPAPFVSPAPPPENIATVTIGPLEIGGNPDDTGDEYGCCTSGSDGYI